MSYRKLKSGQPSQRAIAGRRRRRPKEWSGALQTTTTTSTFPSLHPILFLSHNNATPTPCGHVRVRVRPSLGAAHAFKRRANFFIRGECYSREQRGERRGAATTATAAALDNGIVNSPPFLSLLLLQPSLPLTPE